MRPTFTCCYPQKEHKAVEMSRVVGTRSDITIRGRRFHNKSEQDEAAEDTVSDNTQAHYRLAVRCSDKNPLNVFLQRSVFSPAQWICLTRLKVLYKEDLISSGDRRLQEPPCSVFCPDEEVRLTRSTCPRVDTKSSALSDVREGSGCPHTPTHPAMKSQRTLA